LRLFTELALIFQHLIHLSLKLKFGQQSAHYQQTGPQGQMASLEDSTSLAGL